MGFQDFSIKLMERLRERERSETDSQIDRQTKVIYMCQAMRQKVWEHAEKQNFICLMRSSAIYIKCLKNLSSTPNHTAVMVKL